MTLWGNSTAEQAFGLNRTFRDHLSDTDWEGILGSAKVRWIRKGEQLMRQGAEGHSVSFLKKGAVRIDQDGKLIVLRHPGDLLGDMAVYGRRPRTATVTAYTDCEVVTLGAELFRSRAFQDAYGAAIWSYVIGRQLETQVLSRSGDNVARLAWLLAPLLDNEELAVSGPDGVHLRVAQKDLADCLAIGPKLLRQLTALPPFGGMPEGRRKLTLVTDPEGLLAAAARLGGLP
ncbi:Crp/Fnr family transcriptional regulator [Kitasatospora sp. NPDC059811]|uniref:Crp/Fnr family transcriptional regulator n=1 Tax=Streptomycetaceae TaxID=2062 RepID=UPI0009A005BF|nr:cyclic nucleotide-binding domain-containing protein [Streptomyces sp. MJM8645]